jgi:pimeloyl-ACP methyl ester carboxylesterase
MDMASPQFATWPGPDATVSLKSWMHEIAALGRCQLAPPPFPEDAARGQGEPVLVVPGFCSPDGSTARLRAFLRRQGFAAQPWGAGVNLGPKPATVAAFDRAVADLAERSGRKVALVGISLGGVMAREMAKHRPDCVAQVITLVTPIHLPVTTPLAPLVQLASWRWPEPARKRLAALAEPPPVKLTAIVNPKDGVVDWRSCLPAPGDGIEIVMIEGHHMTMASNPDAQRVVAARLARAAE